MSHKYVTFTTYLLLILAITTSVFMQVKATTWSVDTKQLTTYDYYDGHPALTQTKDGRVWLVWSKEIDSNLTLYYKITSDQGKTWSEEMNLTDNLCNGQDQNPSIMQAQNETIWVVWTSDRPPPPIRDFNMGASPQNLTIPQGESDNSTIIVTSINNFNETVNLMVYDIVPELTGYNITTTFNPNPVTPPANGAVNSTLTISINSTATPGNYTLMVMGKSDHLMHTVDIYLEIIAAGGTGQASTAINTLAFSSTSASSTMEDYEIYYKTSHDNGETWSKDIQLTQNNIDDLRPAIIQLANGTIMIVWQSYILDSHNICYKTLTDGEWSDTTQLTTDSAHDKTPAVTQTKDGKIWVVWNSRRTGDYEIFYKIHNGFTWSNDTQLTNNTNTDVQPAIIQTTTGDILIFFTSGKPTGTNDIYYKYSSDYGSTWSERIEFAASNYEDVWPAVTRAQDTKIWVTWVSNEADQPNGNWEIYCRTSLAGDVNEDGQVNVVDLTIVSLAYGALLGEPDYNPNADINKDGIVDMRDLRIVAYYLGET